MRDLFWARKELATLDPVQDARRYAQLTFETRYGLPIFIHALFSVAFAYNMGDPRIANVLYREGTGTIIKNTRQRNFETLVFFGLIYEHGDGPEGQRIIQRMQRIHTHFRIPNELYLYTLATLACLPRRLSDRFAGADGLSRDELESQFQLWLRVGKMMGIQDIPPTQEAYLAWMLDYEQKNFAYTPGGEAVVRALAAEWADYWFPKPLQGVAENLFYALIDPELHEVLGIPKPPRWQSALAGQLVKGFIKAVRVLPDVPERSLIKTFSRNIDELKLKAKLA
ncbi:uncharacterized protein DUF2236 [Fluviicoccus keumensis]|uniref:Uncharacterized protein DUF2236 n=1 Tax=Fluviicoccus keumensis TaxID=1435465 RepID=A0A4Q7YKW2_9GAMM|nr:oxygenase MpaB family protein [Fluviicoccus keumensis]RZU38322.1 uncharacterized protein DUF2236 [Fluviicoccus keumensis]